MSSCGALEGSSRHQLPLLSPFANRCFSLVCFRLPAFFEYETLGGGPFSVKKKVLQQCAQIVKKPDWSSPKRLWFWATCPKPIAKTRAGFNLRLRDSNETALACLMLQECQQDLVLLCFKEKAVRWSRYQKIKGKFVYQVPVSLHQIILSGGMLETSYCNQLEQKWQTQSRCGPNRWCLFTERSARIGHSHTLLHAVCAWMQCTKPAWTRLSLLSNVSAIGQKTGNIWSLGLSSCC